MRLKQFLSYMLLHTDGLPTKCHLAGRKLRRSWGFTVIEIMISVFIVGTLVAIAIPASMYYVDKARIARVITEIRMLEKEIRVYHSDNQVYPNTLNDIGRGTLPDAWGNPYEYLNIANGNPKKGEMRKDRFLVPVNSDYDLYSMGKDGQSQKPFSAVQAKDDIVRANDGGYIGLASEF